MVELKYFKWDDFACSETGENEFNEDFAVMLDELRHRCGFPFMIGRDKNGVQHGSAYRSPRHSVEVNKSKPGKHAEGIAADIPCNSAQAYIIMYHAFLMGFKGIARGKGFVHVDNRDSTPVVWSY